MIVAVQGCSHGSLSAIYDTVAQYSSSKSTKVDLLLLCGDFQALRSQYDFPSLAVPPKYHALGTFHQYYSGERVAPVLTIVIGGNHEASNYMWELYHGGWLAENIYYMGAAGSVMVDGFRIAGASGIYKDHDHRKGHFEKVPYNNSTLRSVYHIRSYDVAKLMQLPRDVPTIFLSHDWPISIPQYGDTSSLLRRKPFFRSEVQSNTLGSPPLLTLLRHIQPEHWFAAHLHVKFAAVYEHAANSQANGVRSAESAGEAGVTQPLNPDEILLDDEEEPTEGNPDEILIEDDDDVTSSHTNGARGNPEEISIDDDYFDDPPIASLPADTVNDPSVSASEANQALKLDESADFVEAVRKEDGPDAAQGVLGGPKPASSNLGPSLSANGSGRITKFLALDKCGPGKDFIQFLDIPSPSSSSADQPLRLTYDPQWLAITRAFHPFLSLDIRQTPLPRPDQIDQLVHTEVERIEREGLLVPRTPGTDGAVPLVWEKEPVEITRVQRFWPTAPAQGQPGGSPTAWYTNPQTEALCGMLGIENKINPVPT